MFIAPTSAFSAFRVSKALSQPSFSGLVLDRNKPRNKTEIDYLDTIIDFYGPGMLTPAVTMHTLGSRPNKARVLFKAPQTWAIVRDNAATKTAPETPKAKKKKGVGLALSLRQGEIVTLTYKGKAKSLVGSVIRINPFETRRSSVKYDITAPKTIAIVRPDAKQKTPKPMPTANGTPN